jgi:ribosomal protein S12 methylthiotransferase
MQLQQEISLARYTERIGTVQEVLVDAGPEQPGGPWRARASWQAPDIDGSVLIRTRRELPVGGFMKVEVTGAEPYDLIAKPAASRRPAPARIA